MEAVDMEWERLLSKDRFAGQGDKREGTYKNDYDTIICSTLFRRLQDKAQVFPLEEDDYVRTRLTHSLEVSAIGKRLGELVFQQLKDQKRDRWFSCHWEKEFSDVLLCAGLVHDIGNPPFGHFGEYAVREWFQAHLGELRLGGKPVEELLGPWQIQDLYHFEGNAQSLRLLSRTPYLGKMEGFNLSFGVLAAIIKYPVSSKELAEDAKGRYRKMGYNWAERDLFQEINAHTGMNGRRHPLSYLLEAADDIAYRTSDLEDAMVKKVLNFSRIVGEMERYGQTVWDGVFCGEAEGGMGVKDAWGEMDERGGECVRAAGVKDAWGEMDERGGACVGAAEEGNVCSERVTKGEEEKSRKIQVARGVRACIDRLRQLYREEISAGGRKPELTAVQRWNQFMQEVMVKDAANGFVANYDRIMAGTLEGDLFEGTVSGHIIQAISKLSEEFIYTSSVKIKTELFGRRVIESLLGQFMAGAVKYDTDEPATFIDKRSMDMISGFYKGMYHEQAKEKSEGDRLYLRILMVTDYISGMTDNYAKRLYKELFG
jgi:predicted deoxyguanosinetriphosphate triphosphohydrolase